MKAAVLLICFAVLAGCAKEQPASQPTGEGAQSEPEFRSKPISPPVELDGAAMVPPATRK